MLGKVLLAAIDSSPQHRQVLAKAAEMTVSLSADLHVVSVNDLGRHREVGFAAPNAEMIATMEAEVHALLEQARRDLALQGITCHIHAPYGVTAEQIALLARQLRADGIIIGHRHMSWLGRLVEDSVGSDLLAQAPCNVLIVVDPGEPSIADDVAQKISRPR